MTSPHLYAIAQVEAERAVRRELRGAGPDPAAPDRDDTPRRRGGVRGALRSRVAAALVRAGETLGGTHRGEEADPARAA